jgi:hypothetical protein
MFIALKTRKRLAWLKSFQNYVGSLFDTFIFQDATEGQVGSTTEATKSLNYTPTASSALRSERIEHPRLLRGFRENKITKRKHMAQTTNGLKKNSAGVAGQTAHYKFSYDDSLDSTLHPGKPEPARTNAVIDGCENDFNLMSGWFGNIGLDVNIPITVNVTQNGGGASWSASGGNLTVTINPAAEDANQVRYHLVMEMTEQFMRAQGKGWYGSGTEGSEGEGLSRILAAQFLVVNGFGLPPAGFDNSNAWLSSSRADGVNKINLTDDGPDAATGCSLLFLYYLFTQLKFSLKSIISAGAPTLGGVYKNLTGDPGDPFPFFKALVEAAFPGTATITAADLDNPYPIALLSFWTDKNTFGKDEVLDIINTNGGKWEKAFWLIVEGFSKNSFNAIGVTIPALTGSFANLAGITISQSPDIDFENAANPQAPQRIRVPFDITFTNASLVDFPASGGQTYELDASLTVAGTKVPGSDASTQFELVPGADPYFTNIDPTQNNVYYLSQDLRIFTGVPAKNSAPVAGAPAFPNAGNPSVADAYSYIQNLLGWLNDPNNNFTDGTNDPFATGVIPQPGTALTGDSSVTPFSIDIRGFPPNLSIDNNYNFAVARVRLRAAVGSAPAKNVRVFFRLWSTETADADYDTGSTYPSSPDAAGLPRSPLVGTDHVTLPFFATANQTDYTDGTNIRDMQIQTGDRVWAYFGCFLNLYDANNIIDGKPVQAWLTGTHHCIVAQIAYDDAPVIPGASPDASDKLAQRNVQVTRSDNPGPADTHRIPQTFDIRPSGASGPAADPDELMIDWGTIPPGSVASIYWPQVLASDVLALASELYSTHTLSAADTHTIQCKVTGGVTYVPIPTGAGENFAGLFTVDIPTTVVTGQEFNIVVRRIATRMAPQIYLRKHTSPPTIAVAAKGGKAKAGVQPNAKGVQAVSPALPRSWRYVVGTFQIKIPVTTEKVMLFPEENTLAIMKWRLQQMVPSNRWYPVLLRYISYIAARVDGLGGDSTSIKPSLQGAPVKGKGSGKEGKCPGEERVGHTGKLSALIYDRFGDFEGFILDTEDGKRRFNAREPEIEQVVNRAWAERIVTSVFVELDAPHRPEEIVLHCPPKPFTH